MDKLPPVLQVPDVPESEKTPLVAALLELIAVFQQRDAMLQEQVEALKQEIARLKGHSAKPKIRPSTLEGKGAKGKKTKGKKDKKKKNKGGGGPSGRGKVDETIVVKAEDVPAGSRFKGYADFTVQDLVIKTHTTRYRLEKWQLANGHMLCAQLPVAVKTGHYGSKLVSFVLYQYYHAQVTEPLILEELHEWGVKISGGQLHRLITEGHEKFHEEKDEILQVGLQLSQYIHVDDTTARHQGQNGYCTHIGNELFAWFQSTESKSRENFLQLLRAGHKDYVLNEKAIDYMCSQSLPRAKIEFLEKHLGHMSHDQQQWKQALRKWGITKKWHIRIVTEGALIGSALEHGLNPELVIISDDAGQFNVLIHALCWIHAERSIAKLIGYNDKQRAALENARTQIWDLYQILKAYKQSPSNKKKLEIEERFDEIFIQDSCLYTLNVALKRLHKNKRELLLVLEHPSIPLHNNLSEGDIREYVKRRKVSGGTRSNLGRRCRDTFASLKKTGRKLCVSFWDYLNDRNCGTDRIPQLPALIAARAQAP